MEYKSQSFRSTDRTRVSDTPSNYTVIMDREMHNVKEIRLGTIELPRTQYIVEEGYNTLTFSEGIKLGTNGIRFTDRNGTQTDIFVPNYLNVITNSSTPTSNGGGFTTYDITTYYPWDVTKYLDWKEDKDMRAETVPDLVLLGADTQSSDIDRPFVVLTKENFQVVNSNQFTLIDDDGHSRFSIPNGELQLHLHRAPWHIPELLDFINYCVGRTIITMTDDGKFKLEQGGQFDYLGDSSGMLGVFDMEVLPFKFNTDTSNTVAPKMMATLPVGDYTASDVATLLPQFMSLGYLSKDAEFSVLIGSTKKDVIVKKGTYSTPFLLNEAIRLGLQEAFGADPVAVDCAYEGVSSQAVFNEDEFVLGKYRFFGVSNPAQTTFDFPFMVDFSRSSLELINALDVDAIQYGPGKNVWSNLGLQWPHLLGVEFNKYSYEISSTIPATQKLCIKAFNPSIDEFTAKITVTNNNTMFMRDLSIVLPYQTNDVCYLSRPDGNGWTHTTAVVRGAGYATLLFLTLDQALQIQAGDVVTQTIPDGPAAGRQVKGIVKGITVNVVEVYTLISVDSNQFTSGVEIHIARGDLRFIPYTCTLCKVMGFVFQVGSHVPVTTDEVVTLRTGFIDPPRFEIENPFQQLESGIQDTPSLAQRLGIPRTRLSGRNFYLFDHQFNFDPIPYIMLFLKVGNRTNPNEMHMHQFPLGKDTPLAKLIMQTPFTITRNQIMELRGDFGTVKRLEIEFRNPDGSLVNFHGREHSMTIGFVCGAAKTTV